MRIIICDDEQLITEKIKNLIYEYYSAQGLKKLPEIVCYNNSEELLSDSQTKDIVFLDIEMPGFNGIYVGNFIKNISPFTIIIVITSYSEYLDDAMRFNVFRYLSKPINKNRFFENFKDALRHYQSISHNILVHTKNETYVLPTTSIIFIEACQKKVYIYTEHNTYETTETIQYWSQKLPANSFFQTHRSFIVNFSHVKSFDNTKISLTNGYTAYLTRRKYSEFKKNFSIYLEHI